MNKQEITIRNARPDEFEAIGQLMTQVYSSLENFPKQDEQPDYYNLLANVGAFTEKPETELLVAVSQEKEILGAVVFFGDMQYYGSGGTATQEKNAAGFRLLAVSNDAQGRGIGKLLTHECINRAKAKSRGQVVIHTTKAMQTAWMMYERIGFQRSEDLDFLQAGFPVFGFRYQC
jgi:ribosomal protein S18 acetylase RimI-like enzyme